MKKLHLTLLTFALASSILAVSGCTNFLNGGDIKRQLEEEIELANITNPLKVSYYAPTYQSSGTYSDSIIEINFNRSINPGTFSYSIQDANSKEDLTDCYMEPEFYNNNSVVKMRSNPSNAVSVPKGSIRDISVTLSRYIRSDDGVRFSRDDYTFTFRLNSLTDSEPPSIKELSVYKMPEPLMEKSDLITKDFSEWEDSDFSANHVNSVYINISARDTGVGVSKIKVTEELIRDKSGIIPMGGEHYEQTVDFPFSTSENDSNLYVADGRYDFIIPVDGIIKLTIQCADANENVSTESSIYYVVKDTVLIMQQEPIIYSVYPQNFEDEYNIEYDENGNPTVRLSGINTDVIKWKVFDADEWYEGKSTPVQKYKFKIQTGTSLSSLSEGIYDFEYVSGKSEFKAPLEMADTSKDNAVLITCYDEAGNSYFFRTGIPAKPRYLGGSFVTTGVMSGPNTEFLPQDDFSDFHSYGNYFWKKKDSEGDSDLYNYKGGMEYWNERYFFNSDVRNDPPGTTYCVIFQTVWKNGSYGLAGPLSDVYEITTNEDGELPYFIDRYTENTSLPDISFESTYLSDGFNSGTHTLSINLNGDYYDEYYFSDKELWTSILIRDMYKYKKLSQNSNGRFSFAKSYPTEFGKQNTYYLIGIKGSEFKKIMSKTRTLSAADDDNSAPSLHGLCIPKNQVSKLSGSYLEGEVANADDTNYKSLSKYSYIKDFASQGRSNSNNFIYESNGVSYSTDSKLEQKFIPFELYLNKTTKIDDSKISEVPKYDVDPLTLGGQYEYEKTHIILPTYFFDDGLSYYRVKISDKKGNYCLSENYDVTIYRYPEIKCDISNTSSDITITFSNLENSQFETMSEANIIFEYFFSDKNVWSGPGGNNYEYGEHLASGNYFNDYYVSNSGSKFTRTLNRYFSTFKNHFVKTFLIDHQIAVGSNPRYASISAPYYKYIDTDGTYAGKGKIKNLVDSNGMFTLLCDAPTLVHTIYAHKNIGSTVNEWECRGLQISPAVYTESQNIEPDVENVPDGFYYVLVAHFMDGTSAISSVHKK